MSIYLLTFDSFKYNIIFVNYEKLNNCLEPGKIMNDVLTLYYRSN